MRIESLAYVALPLSLLLACSSDGGIVPAGSGGMAADAAGGTLGAGGAAGMPSGGAVASGGANIGAGGASTLVGGTAGAPDGSGGLPGSGGVASGGMDSGAGGLTASGGETSEGSGGSADVGFSCPAGLEGETPVLTGKTPTQIMGVPEVVNSGGFLEGPVWYDGRLYMSQLDFTGVRNGADILVYSEAAGFEVFIENTGSNGLALDKDLRLIAASQQSEGIIAFDITDSTAAAVDVARMYNGKAFNSPNDVTVRSDGTIYFTDPPNNCEQPCAQEPVNGVYRVSPGGEVELLVTTQDRPNGIILSPDESVLYIGGTVLTAHPVMADGSVGEGTPFGNVTGTDGLGMDCAGNIYVALYSMGSVIALDPSGTQLPGSFAVSEVTNLAFGGTDNKTLYITSFGDNRGQLHAVQLEVAGLPF